MPVGAAIGVAGVAGAAAQSSAAKKASKATTQAADQTVQIQREIYNQNRDLQMPFVQGGQSAYARYLDLMGLGTPKADYAAYGRHNPDVYDAWMEGRFGQGQTWDQAAQSHYDMYGRGEGRSPIAPSMDIMSILEQTPGYQASLKAGQRQLNASAASKGGLLSGAAAREALKFGADYATGTYQNALSNALAGSQIGVSATNALSGVGTAFANSTGNALMAAGQAKADAATAQGNALSGLAGNLGAAGAYAYGSSYGGNKSGGAPKTWWG